MNAITPFRFEGSCVRVVEIDGEPWFVGKDVCGALGHRNHKQALSRLPDDERRGVQIVDPTGRPQKATAINEPGAYRLIMTSRVSAAERFKHWLFHEVLPAIRKTGRYEVPGVEEGLSDPAPQADTPPLTRGAVNAWTGYVTMVARIFDRETAQRQYRKTPLPCLGGEAKTADATPEPARPLDGMACLRHLLSARVSRRTVSLGGVARLARRDAATRNGLGDIGVRVDPVNLRGQVAFAVSHPRLQRVFTDTPWAEDWSLALLSRPGAQPTAGMLEGFDRKRRAVLVPWDVVDAAIEAGSAPVDDDAFSGRS